MAFSMVFHLSDALVEELFDQISARLEKGGTFWANINTSVDESRWLEFPFVRRDPDFYLDIAKRRGFEMSVLGTLEALGFRNKDLEKDNVFLEFTA